ncbi:MAG: hypothetical protein BroJett021_35110 [Chloroflexota bacterium]|nr:MAG: hypothetical protein BroJett021_35110 [Chloroflexota bacterium]
MCPQGGKEVVTMRKTIIGGGSSNIDPSWMIPNGDGVSNECRPGN